MTTTNTEKLTKHFCRGKRLLFFPKTADEAVLIQRKLFGMDFSWANGSKEVSKIEDCIAHGMLLTSDGVVYHSPARPDDGLVCTAAQFDENYLPPETVFLLEQFSKISAEIKALAKEVAEIKAQLQPQRLDKPSLKRPDNPAP